MRRGSHTVYDIRYHIVWTTKYRYKILVRPINLRLRELVRQTCEKNDVTIIMGHIKPDHIHILVSCPPTVAPAKLVQYLKGRTSKILQEEFPSLRKRYWGQHMWSVGYFCRTVGTVDEKTVKDYIENQDENPIEEIFKID